MRRVCLALLLVFGVLAALSAQADDREAFLDAESRFLSKDYSLALDRYDEFLRRHSDSVYAADARFRRAVVLYRLGRQEDAYASLSLVEARYRATRYLPYVPFWKAVVEYDRGDYAAAVQRLSRLADAPPDQEALRQSLLYLGKANAALSRPSEAVAAFERLLSVLPKPESEPSALIFLSDLYASVGAEDKTIALWEKLDADALDAATRERVSLRAAESYAERGRTAEAVALFETLSASPRREIAIAALQRLFVAARDSGDEARLQAAVVRAESALRSDPGLLSEFWLRLGADAFRDGRLDLARSYFLRISALLPPDRVDPSVPIYLAEIAARGGNLAEASEILAAAAPYAGTREALLKTRLGWYALRRERWADARAALTDALRALSASGQAAATEAAALERSARAYLSYALYRTDEYAAALDAIDQAGTAVASFPGVARLRAELLRRTGNAAGSLDALDAILGAAGASADPAASEAAVARMALFFENSRHERVVEAAEDFYRRFAAPARLPADHRAAAGYLAGVSAAATGNFSLAVLRLDDARAAGFEKLGPAASWAAYYRAWSLYRLSRFAEAKAAFDSFLSEQGTHPRSYSAAYFSAWCAANASDYRSAVASARRAADLAAAGAGLPSGADAPEELARAAFLEGSFRTALKDYDGAVAAYDRALAARSARHPAGLTTYAVKAGFERAAALELSGKTDAADQAFAALSRSFPQDPLAREAAYRRGELMYRSKRWLPAAERFAAYREAYKTGGQIDGALYFGGVSLHSAGQADAGILLWERLLADHVDSRYRFPAFFAAARAYREKKDWEAAFRSYTSALAEFGDQARRAGAADEAEVLRYLMTGVPEKAARLHVAITNEGGAVTPAGRAAELELARWYIRESAQKEAGLSLLDEVIAMKGEDPASAAEAAFLKGEYYGLGSVEAYERSALAYLDAVTFAGAAKADAKTSAGASLRGDLVPEALFRAVSMRVKSGRTEGTADILAVLAKTYPTSTWTTQARRLLEGNR
jgi:tetratricopeptide (TPR) repeat protein